MWHNWQYKWPWSRACEILCSCSIRAPYRNICLFVVTSQFWSEVQSLCDEFINSCSSSTPVDVLWNNFLMIFNVGLAMIPTKTTFTQSSQPWITRNVKRLSRKKQRAYNRARMTYSPPDWSKYCDLKRQCQAECQQALNNYISSTIFYNRLANLLSQKHNTSYHQTLSWIRCSLSFATFCNTCHSWEQKVPAAGTFWYLHWAVLGGEPGITLKLFVHCCILSFAVVFVYCHVIFNYY